MSTLDLVRGKIQEYADSLTDRIKQSFALSKGGGDLIGIDIGHSAIKVAKLHGSEESNKYTLKKFASVRLSEGAIIEGEMHKKDEIIASIKEAMEKADIKEMEVCIGLSGQNSVTKKLQTAGGTKEEIEDQVIWESEHYLPFPAEDAKIDISILGENQGGGVDVVVGAAKTTLIEEYRSIIEATGLRVRIIDLNILAVNNVINFVLMDQWRDSDNSIMVLDLGAQRTNFIIYRGGIPVFTKEINIGGNLITEEIQRCMSVNYDEAEDLKFSDTTAGGVPEEVAKIIEEVSSTIGKEVYKIVSFYHQSVSEDSISNCIITGGTSLVEKLVHKIKELTKVEVSSFNPFDKIGLDIKGIKEEEIAEISSRGVCALGLAMRKIV